MLTGITGIRILRLLLAVTSLSLTFVIIMSIFIIFILSDSAPDPKNGLFFHAARLHRGSALRSLGNLGLGNLGLILASCSFQLGILRAIFGFIFILHGL